MRCHAAQDLHFSYYDNNGRCSIEVVAETPHEAVVLGINAMKVDPRTLYRLSFGVLVKEPEVYRSISGAMLSA